MAREMRELLKDLRESVVLMNEEVAATAAQEVVAAGFDAYEAINQGLVLGMNDAGSLFEKEEYFVPELLLCSDAMNAGIEILRPHILKNSEQQKYRAVIGVMQGDTHDIGKNLVKIMMDAAGFEVHDLGRNVPPAKFVETAKSIDAHLVCLSTLMTTTMDGMAQVIETLNQQGVRGKHKVLVGGGPLSSRFAKKIGADGYADNAAGAVKVAKELLAQSVAART
jgi:corrinoid protein of di/trimethylamine methyltransferase